LQEPRSLNCPPGAKSVSMKRIFLHVLVKERVFVMS
jgi:hypothetical protein